MLFLILGFAETLPAHPAHAKPVNYPFVVGFERFHSGLDDDDYLAVGGFILLNELNCVACHEPPRHLAKQLPGTIATNLVGVASRLDPVSLELMIRNPRFLKRDTAMPSVFAGPDRDLDEVTALKHYLASLKVEIPDYPTGDVEQGRHFYHRVGCVACHAPEVGYRPDGIPENAEIELAGLPSVPMNLADLYDLDALTHFLLHPHEHRPSGRMPDFQLSEEEATDLAAYLRAGPDLILPDEVTEALGGNEFTVDPTLASQGRALFQSKQCNACHELPEEESSRTQFTSIPLDQINPEVIGGCFSERPPGGKIPFFGLDDVQKRAISAALERLDERKKFDIAGDIDWRMKRLNCYACHERGGVGGPEIPREVYFGFGLEEAVGLGRWGHLPPPLDHVGARLTDDWLKAILHGEKGSSVRPYQAARMPVFKPDDIEPLLRQFPKLDQMERPGLSLNKGDPDHGERLFGGDGKNCISCHGVGNLSSSDLPGINLSTTGDRLRKSYFEALLNNPNAYLPGSPMPDLFDDGKEADKAVDSLWEFLEER